MLSCIWHDNITHSLLCEEFTPSLPPGPQRDCLPLKAVGKLKSTETEEITDKHRGKDKECIVQAVLVTLFNQQKRKTCGKRKLFPLLPFTVLLPSVSKV